MNKRNLGVFRVDARYIENKPHEVAEIFSILKIVPIKVEYCPDWDAYKYLAIGEKFDEVKKGLPAPGYEIISATKNEAGNIVMAAVKRSDGSARPMEFWNFNNSP